MRSIIGFIAQLPAFLLDHPGLLVAAAVVAASAGYITWRRSGGRS